MVGKFCILNTEDSIVWSPINFGHMFMEKFQLEGDQWSIINIAEGLSVPNPDDYDGIVITGSHYNIRDCVERDFPWFCQLCRLIQKCHEQGTTRLYGGKIHIKYMDIKIEKCRGSIIIKCYNISIFLFHAFIGCFGCQAIAHALGGMVDFNPEKKFLCKCENIYPVDNKSIPHQFDLMKDGVDSQCLKVIVSHGDCVTQLPSEAVLLASSESCKNEIFTMKRTDSLPNILACQSHPEFDLQYCMWDRIWAIAVLKNGRVQGSEKDRFEESLKAFTRDQGADYLIEVIKSFLHTRI